MACICGLQELLEKLDREKAILNAAASVPYFLKLELELYISGH